jgi:hypothetical protein
MSLHARNHVNDVVPAVLSFSRFFALLLLALTIGVQSAAAESIGMVTKVENQAQIGSANAVVGTLVQSNNEVRTGPKSRLEITFRDNTKLTLGENATVVIDRFVFNPDASTGELVLRTSAAPFRMVTGRIEGMKNKRINVSTPAAALAVRGTDVWWGPIEGKHGVLLVNHSKVSVRDKECDEESERRDRERCRCEVVLDEEEEGTHIDRNGCPVAPYIWPPGMVTSALASTSFGLAGAGFGPAGLAAAAVAGAAAIATSNNGNGNGGPNNPGPPFEIHWPDWPPKWPDEVPEEPTGGGMP